MTGDDEKKNGQQLALFHAGDEWNAAALSELRHFAARRREFTAEQFRMEWLTQGGASPPSPNCWGALFTAACKCGVIRQTGRYVKARSIKTHAHPVMVWQQA